VITDLSQNYLVGTPYDMNLDKFYVEEWGFKGLDPIETPPQWIQFKNDTDVEEGLLFFISPTMAELGLSYTVHFTLRDIKDNPILSEASHFDFTVGVITFNEDV